MFDICKDKIFFFTAKVDIRNDQIRTNKPTFFIFKKTYVQVHTKRLIKLLDGIKLALKRNAFHPTANLNFPIK